MARVVHAAYDRAGLFERGGEARGVHLLVVVGKVGVRYLLVLLEFLYLHLPLLFQLPLPLLVIVEECGLAALHTAARLGIDEPLHDGLHERGVVVGYGQVDAQLLAYLVLLLVEHVEHDVVHGVVLGVNGGYEHLRCGLSEAVDASVALLHAVGVPRQVVVYDGLEALLQVDTL